MLFVVPQSHMCVRMCVYALHAVFFSLFKHTYCARVCVLLLHSHLKSERARHFRPVLQSGVSQAPASTSAESSNRVVRVCDLRADAALRVVVIALLIYECPWHCASVTVYTQRSLSLTIYMDRLSTAVGLLKSTPDERGFVHFYAPLCPFSSAFITMRSRANLLMETLRPLHSHGVCVCVCVQQIETFDVGFGGTGSWRPRVKNIGTRTSDLKFIVSFEVLLGMCMCMCIRTEIPLYQMYKMFFFCVRTIYAIF